jgi:molybdopterin molybdotransferase
MPARVTGHDASGLPVVVRSGHAGSARLKPLSTADGLLWLPASSGGVAPGDPLRFHPFGAAFSL